MRVKKIMLVVPPTNQFGTAPYPPIGLGYISAVLKENGYGDVVIFDSMERMWDAERDLVYDGHLIGSFTDIERAIREHSPDILGVQSNFTCQYKNVLKTVEVAKSVNPAIVTVIGGHHASVSQNQLMQDANVDFVIAGDGEYPMVDLLKALESGKGLETVPSLSYRNGNGVPTINKTLYLLEELDQVPFPDYQGMDLRKYWIHRNCHGAVRKERFAPIVSSRGCPAKCSFCTYSNTPHKYRARSAGNVIDEIKMLKREFDIEEITFEDDNLTLKMKRAEEIFDRMIQEKLGVVWSTPNGVAVYALNDSLLNKMKATGCGGLNLAIESGNEEVLRNIIHKPLKLKQASHVIKKCRELDIAIFGYFLVGTPGETKEQAWDTFRFIANNFAPEEFRVAFCVPLPGTAAYDTCIKKGYLTPEVDMQTMNLTAGPIFSTKEMSKEEAVKLMNDGLRYVNKRYFVKNFPRSLLNYSFMRNMAYQYFPGFVINPLRRAKAWYRGN